ncbi:FAD-dependent oxidoreductase [Neorhizobium petrolearium]|uniref:FAD-dependent oxidoreductase n=1 Tax=Neorhizobium petrolearium TaxID=515361 RepID=UPI003F13FF03
MQEPRDPVHAAIEPAPDDVYDVVVVGSGGAGLVAGLATAVAGLRTVMLESGSLVGGTTAISGAGIWIPANGKARAAGIADSQADALDYIRACAPDGWQQAEDARWRRLVGEGAGMVDFVEAHTPLRFDLSDDADPYPLAPGARRAGRMLSPRPVPASAVGAWARRIRSPHLPHLLTYQEVRRLDAWHHPWKAVLKRLPQVLIRLLTGARAQGTGLVRGLLAGYIDAGGLILTDARAMSLQADGQGRVTAVDATCEGGKRTLHARRGVVLATGGFEHDAERRKAHFPGPVDFIASPPTNRGDGHRMAEAVGAELARMGEANIAPAIPARLNGTFQPLATFHHREPAAILVGPDGRRFVNEYLFNLGEVLLQRDPVTGSYRHLPAFLVADATMLRVSPIMKHFLRADPAFVRTAPDIDALAGMIGIEAAVLADTVQRFNSCAERGCDEDFGRHVDPLAPGGISPMRLAPLRKPPFVAMPFNLTFLSTKGGPRTDDRGRVLRPDGSAIGGLFCAGVAMANPIGTRAVGSGTTIGPNMTWAWICGRQIVGDLRDGERHEHEECEERRHDVIR